MRKKEAVTEASPLSKKDEPRKSESRNEEQDDSEAA
jgi:small subunit ribosomal protein S6